MEPPWRYPPHPTSRTRLVTLTDEFLTQCAASGDQPTASLAGEVLRLRGAIRTHQEKTGHELCWLNDVELWNSVSPDARYPHFTLPVREEFLSECARFYASRLTGTPYENPKPQRTIGEAAQ